MERAPAAAGDADCGIGSAAGLTASAASRRIQPSATSPDLVVGAGRQNAAVGVSRNCTAWNRRWLNRCATDALAQRFCDLMQAYRRARAVQSGFEMNPSPGNIDDGLNDRRNQVAGAARKGGVAPIRDVLDFPEYATTSGLNLLCTPGNDVECVTAQVGAGANLVLFTTGLGTPTGNPVAPVIKIASNSALAERMATSSTSMPGDCDRRSDHPGMRGKLL